MFKMSRLKEDHSLLNAQLSIVNMVAINVFSLFPAARRGVIVEEFVWIFCFSFF